MALITLLLVCFSTLTQATLFGASVDVTANAWTNASYMANQLSILVVFKVDIKADKTTTCIFNSYTNASVWANLNAAQYQALTTGSLTISGAAASGYSLTCADTTATVEAYITFPALDASVQALLGAGYDAGLVKFNMETGATVRIKDATWYNPDYTLKVHFPSVGIFLLASIKETVSVGATAYSSGSIWAPAKSDQTYTWSIAANNANDVKITFDCEESNTITVQPLMQTTYNITTEKLKEIKVWFNVNLQNEAAAHSSTIRYVYTDAQLQAVGIAASNANKLRLARYDTTAAKWKVPQSGGSVDLQAKVVSQTTTQFSQWGVYMDGGENSSTSLRVQALSIVALFATLVALLF